MTMSKQAREEKAEAIHRQHLEEGEQITLFEWVNWMSGRIPELEMLLHIPNGGKRNKLEAIRLKREGVRAGVPDLFLPVARGKYHGMFVELKAGKRQADQSAEGVDPQAERAGIPRSGDQWVGSSGEGDYGVFEDGGMTGD